jgi:acetyl esterase/lipase
MSDITRRSFFTTAAVSAFIPSLAAVSPQSTGDARGSSSIEKDVVFGKAGDMPLRLDIYRPPAGTAKGMATIHIHGGGFVNGSKDTLAARVAPFAALGYVAIPVQYRLAGAAKWPAQIHDIKAAIRWTRANAKSLGIDPEKIAVVGYSAGGHLALFAAGTANRPEFEGSNGTPGAGTQLAACCAYYAAADVRPQADGSPHVLLPAGSNEAAHRAAAPATYIAKGFPPTVLFHGTADVTVPLESSQRFFKQLLDAQVPAELHAYEGVPHAFDSNADFAKVAAEAADFFIDRKVLHPRTYPPFGGGGGGREGRGGR